MILLNILVIFELRVYIALDVRNTLRMTDIIVEYLVAETFDKKDTGLWGFTVHWHVLTLYLKIVTLHLLLLLLNIFNVFVINFRIFVLKFRLRFPIILLWYLNFNALGIRYWIILFKILFIFHDFYTAYFFFLKFFINYSLKFCLLYTPYSLERLFWKFAQMIWLTVDWRSFILWYWIAWITEGISLS